MTRAKLLVLGLGLALIAVFAAPASAQDGPTLTVEPTNVEAAGEVEFTVTGADFTAAPPIFIVPCTSTNLEDLAATGTDTCDLTALTPTTPADGAFEAVVNYDVPAEGMCIAAGDAAGTEAAGACITVGAADAGAEGDEEVAVTDELPVTGNNAGMISIIALSVLAAGVMTVGYTRRFV